MEIGQKLIGAELTIAQYLKRTTKFFDIFVFDAFSL